MAFADLAARRASVGLVSSPSHTLHLARRADQVVIQSRRRAIPASSPAFRDAARASHRTPPARAAAARLRPIAAATAMRAGNTTAAPQAAPADRAAIPAPCAACPASRSASRYRGSACRHCRTMRRPLARADRAPPPARRLAEDRPRWTSPTTPAPMTMAGCRATVMVRRTSRRQADSRSGTIGCYPAGCGGIDARHLDRRQAASSSHYGCRSLDGPQRHGPRRRAIHGFAASRAGKSWMAGPSPAMTMGPQRLIRSK